MGEKTEILLQELLDREAIRDLPNRYCHCVWQKDVPGIVDLFTADGWIKMGRKPVSGHPALLTLYEKALGDLVPRPFIHNHVIELENADTAKGTCYVEIRGVQDDKSVVGAGYYDDEYRKVDGKWKIHSRDVTMHFMVPLEDGWVEELRKQD
ncbi:MAG: nuclear transport factor 2 family protein [Pseudomonadales bacterium]|nr:nuclear transport factor 2 family protein [Pseudomonadales bacterium]